jgi:formate/nitrite transporter FocA (FNT family)
MFPKLSFVLICWLVSVSTTPMIIYNNARFDPTNVYFLLSSFFPITTRDNCICQCYANSSCITGTFFGFNLTCILFSANIHQGQLSLMTTNSLTSVFSFPNKTIPFGKLIKYFLLIRTR